MAELELTRPREREQTPPSSRRGHEWDVGFAPVPLVLTEAAPLTIPASARPVASAPASYRVQRSLQGHAAAPVLEAVRIRQEVALAHQQATGQLQRQIEDAQASLPVGAEQATAQRSQAQQGAPTVPAYYTSAPCDRAGRAPSFTDVGDLYRFEAARLKATDHGRGVRADALSALQRAVVGQFAQAYRASPMPPAERAQALGGVLATVQRQPFGGEVASVVSHRAGGLPASDLPLIQRALGEADASLAVQESQDARVAHLYALQRQLADHQAQTEQARVMQRVRERQGGGEALPAAVQRHLEQGLNADLSRVRVHTDSEADQLARSVGAKAFTTGPDIYFSSGQYQPNSRTGLELLAHEATHTVQQARGQVGSGLDPDAGLEQQARQMGATLATRTPAQVAPPAKQAVGWTPPQFQPSPYAPAVWTPQAALGRARVGAVGHAYLHPFMSLQRAGDVTIQRLDLNPLHAIKNGADALGDLANKGIDWAKGQLAGMLGSIPGYKPLCLAFGKNLVTGKAMDQNPNAILDALAGFVPGPLKDVIARLRETNAIPRAWAWFKGELAGLNVGSVLSEITGAIGKLPPDLERAKSAVTSRISGLTRLAVASVRKIAEIALDAVAAGLGPVA